MIDEIIVSAIGGLIFACKNEEQVSGMRSTMNMLCNYDESKWNRMTEDERGEWIESYLPKERK